MNELFEALAALQLAVLHPVGLGAMLGTTVGSVVGIVAQRLQARRARVLPYLPSHHEALDKQSTEAIRFFSAVHDMCMAVTEAWNATQSRRHTKGGVETLMKLDALLPACQTVTLEASALRHTLAGYSTLDTKLDELTQHLAAAWSYRNRHNYRTEHYTVTVQDGDGKSHTESRTRQVYENTDHWFDYDADAGRRTADAARRFGTILGKSDLPSVDLGAFRIDIQNIDEVERMFLRRLIRDTVLEDEDAKPTDDEVSDLVNQWISATTISAELSAFRAGSATFDASRHGLITDMLSSQASYHWRTRQRTHSGPPGYRSAQRLRDLVATARDPFLTVSGMISVCVNVADDLRHWAVDHDELEPDLKYARRAVQAYEAAFPDSTIEVDQLPSVGKTLLWVFGTGVAALLLVLLVHPDALMTWLQAL